MSDRIEEIEKRLSVVTDITVGRGWTYDGDNFLVISGDGDDVHDGMDIASVRTADPHQNRALGEFLASAKSDIAYLLAEVKRQSDRADAAEAECLEQACLNGMGAERELALMAKVKRLEGERDRMFPVIDSAVEWWRGSSLSGRRADDLSDACQAYVNTAADASGMEPKDDGSENISVPRGLWHWTLRVEADLRAKLADRTTAADEAEALALSLADALETITNNNECFVGQQAAYRALSDPRLLKLRGNE